MDPSLRWDDIGFCAFAERLLFVDCNTNIRTFSTTFFPVQQLRTLAY